jgi:hypothetical protein
MRVDLAVTRRYNGGGGTDDPGGGLHGSSWQVGAAGGEGNPGHSADKNGDNIGAAEDAMEFQMTQTKARRELQRAGEESDDAAECMRNEQLAIGDYLQTVCMVHRVIDDQKSF